MNARQLDHDGQTTHALIFAAGDEVMAGLRDFTRERNVQAAHFTGIGAFQSATVAYFDRESKDYIKIPVDEQVEVLVLAGDLQEHGDEIGKQIGPGCVVIELGSGSSRKTQLLLDKLEAPAAYVPVDISPAALLEASNFIESRFPELAVEPVAADYTAPQWRPPRSIPPGSPRLLNRWSPAYGATRRRGIPTPNSFCGSKPQPHNTVDEASLPRRFTRSSGPIRS